jgi:hypothetical protein
VRAQCKVLLVTHGPEEIAKGGPTAVCRSRRHVERTRLHRVVTISCTYSTAGRPSPRSRRSLPPGGPARR